MNRKSSENKAIFTPFPEADIEISIPVRFEKQVVRYPNNIAVKDERNTLTYESINNEANRVAHTILATNKDTGNPILILTGYGSPTITAMMGVLKSGKAYTILDPSFPQDRITEILVDSQSNLILTDEENIKLANFLVMDNKENIKLQIVNINKIDSDLPSQNPGVKIPPDAYANILYTSGSTSRPKGVIRDHASVLHSISSGTNAYKITPGDKMLLISSLSFGASTSDIFGALLNGGSVYPFPLKNRSFTQLTKWIVTEEITMCHFVATSFRHFAETLTGDEDFQNIRMIRLGGEAIHKNDVALYKKYFPDQCILRVGLASTEAGSFCWNFINKETVITSDVVPVGHPVDGFDVFLLDENHNPVGLNEVGEIAVRSRFISQGYWQRPDLNINKFLPDPDGGDKRICLTGDLGKFCIEGTLEHITRKDTMVKIRGLRVDISEIEAILLGIDTISDAVIVAREDRFHEKRLVAYLVSSGDSQPSVLELRESIARKLPDYMVPSTFFFLDTLPLTSSGKVNKLELPPHPEGRLISGQEYVLPRNEIETQLVQIFEKHLGVQPVGVKDDFFELGGHSLSAIRIVSDIEETLNKSIPIPEFIEALTVEKISKTLLTSDSSPSLLYLVGLQTLGAKPPLFCVPASATSAMRFEQLAKYLGKDQPVYSFEYAGMDGKSEPFTSIHNMAQAFIQELRTVQPKGPYYLTGLCYGGVVAFEMAQRLVNQGHQVAFLGVLDSNFPPEKRISLIYYYILTKQFIAKIQGSNLKVNVPGLERASKRFTDTDPLKIRFQHIFTTHHIARMGYSSQPYPGKITRFSTDSPHARRSTKGWAKATTGGLDVLMTPGGHGARKQEGQTSFMQEPNVQIVAQKLAEKLKEAKLIADKN
jgi:amino acid adenylation domain-containing protein